MRSQSAMLLLCAAMCLPVAQASAGEPARMSANGSCPGAAKAEAAPDLPEAARTSEPASGAAAGRADGGSGNAGPPAPERLRWQSFLPGMFK